MVCAGIRYPRRNMSCGRTVCKPHTESESSRPGYFPVSSRSKALQACNRLRNAASVHLKCVFADSAGAILRPRSLKWGEDDLRSVVEVNQALTVQRVQKHRPDCECTAICATIDGLYSLCTQSLRAGAAAVPLTVQNWTMNNWYYKIAQSSFISM